MAFIQARGICTRYDCGRPGRHDWRGDLFRDQCPMVTLPRDDQDLSFCIACCGSGKELRGSETCVDLENPCPKCDGTGKIFLPRDNRLTDEEHAEYLAFEGSPPPMTEARRQMIIRTYRKQYPAWRQWIDLLGYLVSLGIEKLGRALPRDDRWSGR